MSLKNINLKSSYDSDEDNILEDFYIPILSQSIIYKRNAGYFSSNSFAVAARGIGELIKNGGRIQLLANYILSEDDYKIMTLLHISAL